MSSLIDFENNRSSQDDDMQMIDESAEAQPTEEEKQHADDHARKEMMLEVSFSLFV